MILPLLTFETPVTLIMSPEFPLKASPVEIDVDPLPYGLLRDDIITPPLTLVTLFPLCRFKLPPVSLTLLPPNKTIDPASRSFIPPLIIMLPPNPFDDPVDSDIDPAIPSKPIPVPIFMLPLAELPP